MLRFKTKVGKEKFYDAEKKNIWNFNVDNIII